MNPKYPLSNFVFRILKTDIKKVVCITHTTEKMLSISTYFKTNRVLSFNVGYHGRESYGKLNRQDTYMPNGQTLANYHFNLFCVGCLSVYVITNTLSNIDNSPGLNKARVSKAWIRDLLHASFFDHWASLVAYGWLFCLIWTGFLYVLTALSRNVICYDCYIHIQVHMYILRMVPGFEQDHSSSLLSYRTPNIATGQRDPRIP